MNEPLDKLHEFLQDALERSEDIPPSTSILIHRSAASIEVLLDTKANVYGEWIKGEGADICLYRCQETGKVMGCRLPLIHSEVKYSEIDE